MESLPPEMMDEILQYVHPGTTDLWRVTNSSYPKDTRHKSNHEYLLRGSSLRFAGIPHPEYKAFRLLSPFHHFYTCALFHTVFLYPHIESFHRLMRLISSPLNRHVRRVVISLPFVTRKRTIRGCSPDHSKIHGYWHSIPDDLSGVLTHFRHLNAVIILPSWERRMQWMEGRTDHVHHFAEAFNPLGYGCLSLHPECIGENELSDLVNLRNLLTQIVSLDGIKSIHVCNLGAEWLTFLQLSGSNDTSHLLPLSPATTASLELDARAIYSATFHSCALHDLVHFTTVFRHLVDFRLDHISARHSTEVDLFATMLNRDLFPQLLSIQITASDLRPSDYMFFFTGFRKHGGLTSVKIQEAHVFCPDSNIGNAFHFNSRFPKGELQHLLARFIRNEDVSEQWVEENWLQMFRAAGET